MAIEFAGVAVDAEEVLIRSEDIQMLLDKLINDLVGRIFFASDFLIEIVVNVRFIGYSLIEIVLIPLNSSIVLHWLISALSPLLSKANLWPLRYFDVLSSRIKNDSIKLACFLHQDGKRLSDR